jgi:DNA/RNA-binding domain of Phe-tRNA-synthetase-like protein
LGVSSKAFPSSIEALLRRALKAGDPFSINALVDFYNTLSLRHVVPVGGFDLDQLHDPLELRLTREGDTFTALGEQTAMPVPAGEVAYADGQSILTRHFVWRQAQMGLITPYTHSVFLVSEILDEVGQDVAEAVLADLQTGIQTFFKVPIHAYLLDERTSATLQLTPSRDAAG